MPGEDALIDFLEKPTQHRFALLLKNQLAAVNGVATRVLGDRQLREDVTHDVFLKVLESAWRPEQVRSAVGFLTWLTLSTASTMERGEQRRRERELERELTCRQPAEGELSAEDRLDVRAAVARLPPPERKCVVLVFYGGMGTGEAATALGVSQRTVQKRLEKAYAELRRVLKPNQSAVILPVLAGGPEALPPTPSPSPGLEARLSEAGAKHFAATRVEAARRRRRLRRRSPASRGLPLSLVVPVACGLLLLGLLAFLPRSSRERPRRQVAIVPNDLAPPAADPAPRLERVRRARPAPPPVALPGRPLPQKEAEPPVPEPAPETTKTDSSAEVAVEPQMRPVEITIVDEFSEPIRKGTLTIYGPGRIPSDRERELGADDPLSREEAQKGRRARVWLSRELTKVNPVTFGIMNEKNFGLEGHALVEIDGYPRIEYRKFVLEPDARVRIVVPSKPEARVEVRDARTEAPIAEALVVACGSVSGEEPRKILARTGDDGISILRGLTAEPHELEVSAWGYLTARLGGVDLRLGKLIWLHRQKTPPSGRVRVRVYSPAAEPWGDIPVRATFGGRVRTLRTDPGGYCVFEEVPAGRHEIVVPVDIKEEKRTGTFFHAGRVSVAEGESVGLTLGVVPETATLALEIVDSRGEGVTPVMLRLKGPEGGILHFKTEHAGTQHGLAAGFFRLQFLGPTRWILPGVYELQGGTESSWSLRYGRGVVRGRVSGAGEGKPHECWLLGEDRRGMARVGEDGRFEFTGVLPGTYELRLHPEGSQVPLALRRRAVVRPDGEPGEVEIALGSLAGVTLRLSGRRGYPPRVTGVVATSGEGERVALEACSSGLRAREYSGLLPAGRHTLEVHLEDGEYTEEITVGAGEERVIERELAGE